MKIVVIDLDETLGYFTQFGVFWDSLMKYYNSKNKIAGGVGGGHLSQESFNETLDLYPEFLRPNIINILNYIKKKKQNRCCRDIMIYTNNQGPPEWRNYIQKYFHSKIDCTLFNRIIAAFKINGKHVEICRTTHVKNHTDLIRCTKLPPNTEICYLDDSYYPEMSNDYVFYIIIKPYYHGVKFEDMIKRYINKFEKDKNLDKDFTSIMMQNIRKYNFQMYNKTKEEQDLDTILSKEIIFRLQEFFNKSKKNKTIKNTHGRRRRKTYKNYDILDE